MCFLSFILCFSNVATVVDRTKTQTVTDAFVHIAYEEVLEKKALIRKDFRETWLFDNLILNRYYYY